MSNIKELLPDCKKFEEECEKFKIHEKRDAMYEVTMFLVKYYLKKRKVNISGVTNGLGVLLLTWNQAFYRYGIFDFEELEKCISYNIDIIKRFRRKGILKLSGKEAGQASRYKIAIM